MLTEAVSGRGRTGESKNMKTVNASRVLKSLEQHILLDGFKIVIDLEKSRGSYLHNAVTGQRLIDLYGFFGSNPVGFNHPYFDRPEVQADLLRAARIKIANSDVYSECYAEFVDTFTRVARTASARAFSVHRGRRARHRKYAQGGDGLEGSQKHGCRTR